MTSPTNSSPSAPTNSSPSTATNSSPLDALAAGAVEAETEAGRHRKETAILATVARVGLADSTLWNGFKALRWSRADFEAIAGGIWTCLLDRVALHPDTVRARMGDQAPEIPDAILSELLSGSQAVDVTVAREYVETLADQDRRRELVSASHKYRKRLEDGEDPDAALSELLKTIEHKKLVRQYPTEAEEVGAFVESLAARHTDGRQWLGLDSGFHHLNEVLNGLTEGVFILAGPPSLGKTTLAKQIADQVAEAEQVPVLFWSFEQSKEDLRVKSLARLALLDSRAIRKGRTDAASWPAVEKAAERYGNGPGRSLTVIEADRTDNVEAIRAAALIAKHKAGGEKPVLLVIDYLQIMPTPDGVRLDGIKDRVDWNLSELRRLARDLKSPVLVISSENREAYKNAKTTRPTLTALKESGGIEYSADAVFCLWRDNEESDTLSSADGFGRKTVRVNLLVLKNRNGELAKICLDFTPAWAVFDEGRKEDLAWADALGGE